MHPGIALTGEPNLNRNGNLAAHHLLAHPLDKIERRIRRAAQQADSLT